MMLGIRQLPVAYRDAVAADLGLHLDLPAQDALVVRAVRGDGWRAELRILSASHQVLLERDGRGVWSETVACRLEGHPAPGPLPVRRRRASTAVAYTFRSTTSRLAPGGFRRKVDGLLEGLATHPHAVCGVFPGDALAATGLVVRFEPGGAVSWRSCHTYPQTGEVVTTSSRVALRAEPGEGSR